MANGLDARMALVRNHIEKQHWWTHHRSRPPEGSGHFIPSPSVRHIDGALHGYHDRQQKPTTNLSSSWREHPSGGPENGRSINHGNTLYLPSMSAKLSPHSDPPSPNFMRGSSGKLATAGLMRKSSGRLRIIPGTERMPFDEWMSTQRVPTEMDLKHNRKSFVERLYQEGMQSDATGLVSRMSPQRAPRNAAAPRPPHDELSATHRRVARHRHTELHPLNQDATPIAHMTTSWGGMHIDSPNVSPHARRIGRSDVLNSYSRNVQGGNVAAALVDYGASTVDKSYAVDRHIPEEGSWTMTTSPTPSPPFARGRSDLHYNSSPRRKRAEYFAQERRARDDAEHNQFRRMGTSVTVPELDGGLSRRPPPPDLPRTALALASTDIHPAVADRAYRLAQCA